MSSEHYEAVNAMLLNEFLKAHRKVEQQATTIAQQRKDFQDSITKLEATAAHQQKQIGALTAGLQKVSARKTTYMPGKRYGTRASKYADLSWAAKLS